MPLRRGKGWFKTVSKHCPEKYNIVIPRNATVDNRLGKFLRILFKSVDRKIPKKNTFGIDFCSKFSQLQENIVLSLQFFSQLKRNDLPDVTNTLRNCVFTQTKDDLLLLL